MNNKASAKRRSGHSRLTLHMASSWIPNPLLHALHLYRDGCTKDSLIAICHNTIT